MNDLTERTKSHYDKLIHDMGDKYINYRWKNHPIKRSHYLHTKTSIQSIFENYIGKVDNLLEIGCGPGTWTDICLRYADRVTLFDISEEMLKVVKHKYRHSSNVRYRCGDFITDGNKFSDYFDVIFSARAIEYMSDKKIMVTNCYDHLKTGGWLAIITKNPFWRDKKKEKKRRKLGPRLTKKGQHIQIDWIYWKDLVRIFRDTGMTVITVRPVALGSYLKPLNNILGVKICDLIYKLVSVRDMKEAWDYLSESYLILGKKTAN